MPAQSARSEVPNERRDVLAHYTQIRHAATGEKRDTWLVFLGLEKHAECATGNSRLTVRLVQKERRCPP
jgi:hypothetical protein